MKKIYAMLPCYNEEGNIGKLIEKWIVQGTYLKKNAYELKIVVIDDCSIDGTLQEVYSKKRVYNNIEIIHHTKNLGLCGGINSALNYFDKNASADDLLVFMDGDNTHNPKYIHDMIEKIGSECNCVIASRYEKNSKIYGLSNNRVLLSNLAKIYYKCVLSIPNVNDYTCGYRMYTYEIISKLLKKYGDTPIKEKSFACAMELLYKVYIVGGKFVEIAFQLEYDEKLGKSKMNISKTVFSSVFLSAKLKILNNKFIILFVLIFSVLLSLGTNYSPINRNTIFHDCGIFSYIAYAMKNGRVLYTEIFDNKGPLLYFIYYMGLSINERFGIYLLELLSIIISVAFSYKTIKLITNNRFYATMGIIYSFSVWGITFYGGSFSENFAMPIILIGIYILARILTCDKRTNNLYITMLGFLTGLVAMLRLNMLAIFLGCYVVIAAKLINQRQIKEIFRWSLWGMLGFLISILPALYYLIKNNALNACLSVAYLDILNNYDSGSLIEKISVVSSMFKYFNISGATTILIIFIIATIINYKKIKNSKYKWLILAILLSIVINTYANSLSGAFEMHYFITFIPIVVVVIGFVLKVYDKVILTNKKMVLTFIILLTIIMGYTYYAIFTYGRSEPLDKNNNYIKIINYIQENSDKNDYVQLIGGREEAVCANFNTRRLAASKYSYLPLWPSFTKKAKIAITNEIVYDIMQNYPKLIFIYRDKSNEFYSLINDKDKWSNFIKENYIIDDKSIEGYVIYKTN